MYKNGSSYRNETHYALETALRQQMLKRSTMPLDAWIAAERKLMFDAVNRLRHTADREPLPIMAVEEMERQALGHSDYVHKFALYCSELVVL